MRNEYNGRNGLRRDVSMVVVVVRSQSGHARCFLGAPADFGQGSFRSDSGLDLPNSPPSQSQHLFHTKQGCDYIPAMTITPDRCP